MDAGKVRKHVRSRYGDIAVRGTSCCGAASGCGGESPADEIGRRIGYPEEALRAVPDGANLGLGCGHPTALAFLKRGETVLDLGSGAGFDCFLAAREVGPEGRVIGVDMTPEMVEKARENARRGGYGNVEFRLGEIENLPVADGTVDAVVSNCVINLSPDKRRVAAEAFRVLKPGGRLMISDLVVSKPLPEAMKESVALLVGCVAGAVTKDEYLETLGAAGFRDVAVVEEIPFPMGCCAADAPEEGTVASIRVKGVKPAGAE